MEKYPLVRTIYLYIFALLGLILVIIGGVGFINLGLKAYVFTRADDQQRIYSKQPPMPISIEKIQSIENNQTADLTDQDKTAIKQWLADYKIWKDENDKLDPISSQRQSDAAHNLAFMIVGLPLYLYHWSIIKKETKKKEEQT